MFHERREIADGAGRPSARARGKHMSGVRRDMDGSTAAPNQDVLPANVYLVAAEACMHDHMSMVEMVAPGIHAFRRCGGSIHHVQIRKRPLR